MKLLKFILKIPLVILGLALGATSGIATSALLSYSISKCRSGEFCMGEPYIAFLGCLILCPVFGLLLAVLACRLVAKLSDSYVISFAIGVILCLTVAVWSNYQSLFRFPPLLLAILSFYIALLTLITTITLVSEIKTKCFL